MSYSSPRPSSPLLHRGNGTSLALANRSRRLSETLRIWWREIDRGLLALIIILMAMGSAAVLAAAPAGADQYGLADEFGFFKRHIVFQALGLAVMLGLSFASREDARRIGILAAACMLIALLLVPVIGVEKNGARRWLDLGMSLQPSEFLKPGFAIVLAWIFSWRMRDPSLPVVWAASALMGIIGVLLMLQPNFGETILFAGTWFVLVFLSGVSVKRLGALIALACAILAIVYLFYENGRNRIDSFIGGGTAFDQVDLAQRTLLAGGWTGSGLWLGVRKMNLPEAHTDYIFSVIGEEGGLLSCALFVIMFFLIIWRVFVRLAEEENMFAVMAGTGLIAQFGGQAFINILVNLKLFPSTGMTLPLISYGGSSTLAVCFGLGLLLAITRRNPFLERSRDAYLKGTAVMKEKR